MDGRKICAVWKKQVKDTLKNKVILIQFIMFPMLTAVMQNAMDIQGMPKNYFVTLFANHVHWHGTAHRHGCHYLRRKRVQYTACAAYV